MGIRLDRRGGFEDLREHLGHQIVLVSYGRPQSEPVCLSIECTKCHEVLLSFERQEEEREPGHWEVELLVVETIGTSELEDCQLPGTIDEEDLEAAAVAWWEAKHPGVGVHTVLLSGYAYLPSSDPPDA